VRLKTEKLDAFFQARQETSPKTLFSNLPARIILEKSRKKHEKAN